MGGRSTSFPIIMPWEIGGQQTPHWLPAFPSHFQNFARGMSTNLLRPDRRVLPPFSERRPGFVLKVDCEIKRGPPTGGRGAETRGRRLGAELTGLTTARSFEKRKRKPSNTNLLSAGTKSMSPCSPPLFGKPLPFSLLHSHLDGPHTDENNQKCARREFSWLGLRLISWFLAPYVVQGAKFGLVSRLRELALSFWMEHLVSNLREGLDVGDLLAVRREVY